MTNQMINSHKSIVFLNGTFPKKKIFKFLNTKVPLIASDGAIQKMSTLGFSPDYVIGDLDSCKKQNKNTNTIKILDQNSTDFEKCLVFIKKTNLFPSLIIGVNGGEIDHILGNIQVMTKHASKIPMYFLDTYHNKNHITGVKLGIPISKQLTLTVAKRDCLSIIAFEKIVLSTKGLKWEFLNKTLHIDGILGLRNETVSNHIEIILKKGKAFIIIDVTKFFSLLNI